MAPFTTGTNAARTGAISVTAVLSATGLLATPAHAADHHTPNLTEAPPVTSSLSLIPASIERALAPAAAPVVIAAVAPMAVAASTQTTHTVVRGDTVWDLARHYGSTVTAIIDANSLDARATIHLGDVLVIPGATAPAKSTAAKSAAPATTTGTHTVASGDTVWDIAQQYKTDCRRHHLGKRPRLRRRDSRWRPPHHSRRSGKQHRYHGEQNDEGHHSVGR